jgi:hypothetical protein
MKFEVLKQTNTDKIIRNRVFVAWIDEKQE